eukprot:13675764-Heterocapsa_arctica.AAC.1
MLLRAVGGVTQMLTEWNEGYPCKLFSLLDSCPVNRRRFAETIVNDPDCLKDTFALKFIRRYATVDRLCSFECRALLQSLALFTRPDISRIEC